MLNESRTWLLLAICLLSSIRGVRAAGYELVDPHPAPGNQFGAIVQPLPGGNVVVTAPGDSRGGAIYLFNGRSYALISTLTGSAAGDAVGSGPVTVLSNGNYVVRSLSWNGGAGAVTWGSSYSGVNGVVSPANSLTGSAASDQLGSFGVTALGNGNYVVDSPNWSQNVGAVTWGNGLTGVAGAVSSANSLTGSVAGDLAGVGGVTPLPGGHYVVDSYNWGGNKGAATWAGGAAAITGAISAANSLTGSLGNDQVGLSGVTVLSNGNYVVKSPHWGGNSGAATWGSGSGGLAGTVGPANSLTGSAAGDYVGGLAPTQHSFSGGVQALANGNYVVTSPYWSNSRGAATWGDGNGGSAGALSPANSLTGSAANDQVAAGGATSLSNGNYVVASPSWSGGTGAATWGNGGGGTTGPVSAANSLVGSTTSDGVAARVTGLPNGNYVVVSVHWNGNRGAATWGNGGGGTVGAVSPANSLTGSVATDYVGAFGVTSLSNGNYVVSSSDWNGVRGAATWCDGNAGTAGAISAANSLIGTNPNDLVGSSVNPLPNGNYVVRSPDWNGYRGAVTWSSGNGGTVGTVGAGNSLTGATANDFVGRGLTALSNGNYIVSSPDWNGSYGATTWCSGTGATAGNVAPANSLTGSAANDYVGSVVIALANGNYVVSSPHWNGELGAVTWGGGNGGTAGPVTPANSLTGSAAGDNVGNFDVVALNNGNYLVNSANWSNNRGAATRGNGSGGTVGPISPANSLTGETPNAGLAGLVIDNVNGTFLANFVTDTPGGRVRVSNATSAWTAVDIAVGPDNKTRALWNNSDNGASSIWVLNAGGAMEVNNQYGPYTGWSARGIAAGADGMTRVLWTTQDGRAALWTITAGTQSGGGGSLASNLTYGPYAGWAAVNISVGSDNLTRVLWQKADGTAALWVVDHNGGFVANNTYGPYTGWTPQRVTVGGDNKMRVLWNKNDGASALWLVGPGDQTAGGGALEANVTYGPFAGWSARSIAVGGDNNLRALWNKNDGSSALWLVDGSGHLAVNNIYGPYGDWSANALAVGADNKMRALWTRPNGTAAFWTVAPGDQSTGGGSLESNLQFGPY